jgi:hypothetical protein
MLHACLTSSICATCPAHHTLLDLITIIIFGAEFRIWRSLLHIFPASWYFLSLKSKYFPQQPVLNHTQSMLFP